MVSMADARLSQPVSSGDLTLDRRFKRARESFATGDAGTVAAFREALAADHSDRQGGAVRLTRAPS